MALERGAESPPEGVKVCDWERVLAARREEQLDLAQLRRLGPEVKPDQIVAATDDVLVKRPEKGRSLCIRTARVATCDGFRYLKWRRLRLCCSNSIFSSSSAGPTANGYFSSGDGARWIRNFFTDRLKGFPAKEFVLDWYHLTKKCYEFSSMICKGRKAKAHLMSRLIPCLWQGKLDDAIAHLQSYRPQCRNEDKLDELIQYLKAREPYITNYKERRANRIYIGSGHAEKACDLIVARRQKHKGMHWSQETAESLAALKTLVLNKGWDSYWESRQVLPLAAAA